MPDGTMRQFALGTASKDDRCPITHEHAFYIGSISKLVTSVLVWDALRSETLSMDAPVTDTLSLKQFPPDLTVHELLHHTSGAVELTQTIGHLLKLLQPFASFSPDDLAKESDWFDVARRGDFHYANSSFMLLGRLLEVSSGRQYPEILADTLNELDPEIRMFWRDRPSELMVPRGYGRDVLPWPGVLDVTPFRRPIETGGFAAGGILSDAKSMVLLVDHLFSRSRGTATGDMQAYLLDQVPAQDPRSPELVAYGSGVRIWDLDGERWIGHTGTQIGFSGLAFHNMDRDFSVVVFANLSVIDQAGLLRLIGNAVS